MNEIPISDGGKRILNTMKDEMFPIQNKLKELLVRIHKSRVNFSLFSKDLAIQSNEYESISTNFFEISQKLQTPDILFLGLKNNAENIAAYFQYQQAVMQSIDEGSKYIEIIDRTLDRKLQTINNFRTQLLAVVAIIASLITFLK
jgi:hypothetical protein